MSENAPLFATLFERAEEYSKSTIELFKLKAIDKSADVASSLISRLAVVLMVILSILIINIGVALWIGKQLGDSFYGFLITGAFYALLALCIHVFRRQWIKYPISRSIIKKMLKQKS